MTEHGLPKIVRMTAAEVLAAYRQGQREFHYVDIRAANLSHANLENASFYGGNLAGVDLSHCHLQHVQLKSADLRGASLAHARVNATDLIAANFTGANLSWADFTGACLVDADLSQADLTSARLGNASLRGAHLTGARFRAASLSGTDLADLDVAALCNEVRLKHHGPSTIDFRTVIKSYHHPRLKQFMIDCGVSELFAEFMIECARASSEDVLRSLMQSTFISYGGPDEAFARKLYGALKAHKVVTFFFPETATVGERINNEVFHRINEHDRILLVCSRKSLDRVGVVNEIQEALDREARDGGATYLLPITIDDYVLTAWKKKQPALAERIGRRVIADFRGAHRSKARFDQAVTRVIDALKKKHPRL